MQPPATVDDERLSPHVSKKNDPTLSAVERLPPEVLGELFTMCTYNGAVNPLRLSHVCRLWRDVVHSSPRVWQSVTLDDRVCRTPASFHEKAALWIARSGVLPFDVDINFDSSSMLLPMLSPFLGNLNRWRNCRIMGRRIENVDPFYYVKGDCDPRLEELSITVGIDDDLRPVDPDPERVTEWYSKTALLRGYPGYRLNAMEIYVADLPPADHLVPLHGLTTLTISHSCMGCLSGPMELLMFLSACPDLQTFRFDGWPEEDDPFPNPPPVVVLPQLRKIILRNTCSMRAILSHMYTPALEELRLQHLNVDFEMGSHFTEPGDSADEVADFSQSPWSDRATGLGVRRLIERCAPPIRVLEMDYADMRTKDFRWCFERLSTLEQFRIVASDMADKVIQHMLLPVDDDGPNGSYVHLPRLSTIELCRCQRLTGDALESVFRSRVEFATKNPGKAALLEKVAILGCISFTGRHEENLTKVLPKGLNVDSVWDA